MLFFIWALLNILQLFFMKEHSRDTIFCRLLYLFFVILFIFFKFLIYLWDNTWWTPYMPPYFVNDLTTWFLKCLWITLIPVLLCLQVWDKNKQKQKSSQMSFQRGNLSNRGEKCERLLNKGQEKGKERCDVFLDFERSGREDLSVLLAKAFCCFWAQGLGVR